MPRIATAQFISIAAQILEVEEDAIRRAVKLGSAESALAAPYAEFGEYVQYPDEVERAAIACSRILRNHPLPDGNKRAGFIVMVLMLEDLGLHLPGEPSGIAAQVEALAAGTLTEEA